MSCAYICRALDQTVLKTNLAKFTHSKCSTLIVTDLVAWSWTSHCWTMLSTFSFPAKDKLCLHHMGHVA